MRRLSVALLGLLLLPACSLCWPRGGAIQTCPADDDDTTDDDDATDDDDGADDDDATDDDDVVEDPCAGAPTTYAVGSATLDVVCVPGDRFVMGSPESEPNRSADETQHPVILTRALLVSVYETTQLLYAQGTGGLAPSSCTYGCGDDYPVQRVDWNQALAFADLLSELHGLDSPYSGDPDEPTLDLDADGWRLPTESEWEFLARGGAIGEVYAGGSVLEDVANCVGPNPDFYEALPVGSLDPNGFGLYDMSGNNEEWVWDRYGHYPTGEVTDPVGASFGSSRAFRGGSFSSTPSQCRSADRASGIRGRTDWDLTFRLVRTFVAEAGG